MSPMEHKLLSFMRAKGIGADVAIDDMFTDLVGPAPNPDEIEARSKQQYVGAFVSRVNNKQDVYEIVPGKMKRTYCVQHKPKQTAD